MNLLANFQIYPKVDIDKPEKMMSRLDSTEKEVTDGLEIQEDLLKAKEVNYGIMDYIQEVLDKQVAETPVPDWEWDTLSLEHYNFKMLVDFTNEDVKAEIPVIIN
jgi:hypothetical protein